MHEIRDPMVFAPVSAVEWSSQANLVSARNKFAQSLVHNATTNHYIDSKDLTVEYTSVFTDIVLNEVNGVLVEIANCDGFVNMQAPTGEPDLTIIATDRISFLVASISSIEQHSRQDYYLRELFANTPFDERDDLYDNFQTRDSYEEREEVAHNIFLAISELERSTGTQRLSIEHILDFIDGYIKEGILTSQFMTESINLRRLVREASSENNETTTAKKQKFSVFRAVKKVLNHHQK